jgi:hypothetical protein
MSIILQGSTSGSVTLQEPAVAGTTILTLPATSGTILTSASAISASSITTGTLPYAQLPIGSVLQLVTTTKTNTETSSSSGYIDVGLDATITPKSSTSRIFIMASVSVGCNTPSANVAFRIRNTTAGTTVSSDPYYIARWPSDGQSSYYCQKINIMQIDSPATTSATTYKIQMKTNAGSFQVNMAADTGGGVTGLVSTMTVMEIAT